MDYLRIDKVKYEGDLKVTLVFNDGVAVLIDFGSWIRCNPHPQYNKYLDEQEFLRYTLDDGNIVWGEDWDLIFPIEQLHAGVIA